MGDVSLLEELCGRIAARDAVIGVVGLGYVGLPVAAAFAEAGFKVVGVDVDETRVGLVKVGKSYLRDVPDATLLKLRDAGRLRATSSFGELSEADAILMCVPTPLMDGVPDLRHIEASGSAVGSVLKRGALVVLESTTYPGTTEELLKPLLEAHGQKTDQDFFLAYSPERIDPGNSSASFRDIPKIVGGTSPMATRAAVALYEQVVPGIVEVSGTREAELAKLIENTFRHVNIALVNELAIYAHEMRIDIWQAIEAASTKPFGFLAFWPGPGWGGHCIPLDPAYLSWHVKRTRDHDVRFVELAHEVNAEMPRYVVERATLLLNEKGKAVKGSKILGVGIAYKGGTEDTRGSPAIRVLKGLAGRKASIAYHDPLVDSVEIEGATFSSLPLSAGVIKKFDLVVVLAPQVGVDWRLLARAAPLLLDCCNALGITSESVFRL